MSSIQRRISLDKATPRFFFLLPLEIRTIIYSLVLISHSDISIPTRPYKRNCKLRRRKTKRTSNAKADLRVPFICNVSGNLPCPHRPVDSHPLHPSQTKANIETAILLTCHQINAEASRIVYEPNTFYFEETSIAWSFRLKTNQMLASHISSIHVVYGPAYLNVKFPHHNIDEARDRKWSDFLTTNQPSSLKNDFPHLKYVTLTLGRGLEKVDSCSLKLILRPWACILEKSPEWVQIIGLNNETGLSYFAPLVIPADPRGGRDSQSYADNILPGAEVAAETIAHRKARVQKHVSGYAERPGWKNAIFWWCTSATPPCQIRSFRGDPRWRRRLYQADNEGVRERFGRKECSVGESYSEGLD